MDGNTSRAGAVCDEQHLVDSDHERKAAWWRQRFDDFFRASVVILGGLAALAGIAIASLLGGGVSPAQVKYAQLVLGQTGLLMLYASFGLAVLYILKISNFGDIYASPHREWAKRFFQKHPRLKWVSSAFASLVLMLFLVTSAGYPIAMPLVIGGAYLGLMPQLNDEIRCEAEYWRSLQEESYRPAVDCRDIIAKMKGEDAE